MSASIVTALQDGLVLFKLLAADYVPRTHKQLVDVATERGCDWSSTKIHNMLATLAAEGFVRQSASGEWSVAPQITAIAASYYESVSRRAEALTQEVDEINQTIKERIS